MAETFIAQQMLDQEMIARIGRRDQSAFSALYDRMSGPLYSMAMKMLGDPAEAQDALQDVFLQIWSRAGTYDPEQSSVFSWTVLLTRSRVIDRLRARGRTAILFQPWRGARSNHGCCRGATNHLETTEERGVYCAVGADVFSSRCRAW